MEGSNFSQYLSELHNKKQNLIKLAQKAAEFGWIPKEKSEKGVISLQEIIEKLEKDTLTIGVIGQMKCGKSTFLNSFIFEDSILPAATTPMTAALSVITYGEKEHIVAEFYTADEWEEQKQQAERSLDDACGNLDQSKIKAAKELVERSSKLGSELNSCLGKTKDDSFENLIEYVGADGKYVSITKSVTIYYPKEYLKGVEIVDTPGFNDPIVSREERTKEFLKKADVVLMMLYAGRPFDSTDRDIIFKNVRQCGIGKVLIGINKYDIPFCSETNPENEETIKQYVKDEINKACRECDDNTLIEILKDVEPIPLSAEMALLSEIPMTKISSNEAFNFAWKRHCSNFEISSQIEMRQKSHLDNLIDAVKEMIDGEKNKILFAKPLNAIFAAGDTEKNDTNNKIDLLKNNLEVLKMPDDELEERQKNLSKINKRINRKIEGLGNDLDSEMRTLTKRGKNELEDSVNASCNKMRSIVNNEFGRLTSIKSIQPKIETELSILSTITLKRICERLMSDGERIIKVNIKDFFADVEDILMRFLPNFDSQSFIKNVNNEIIMELEDKDLFSYDNTEEDESFIDKILDIINAASYGLLDKIGGFINYDNNKNHMISFINQISSEFDPDPYLENAFHSKDSIIDKVRSRFINELIEPLQVQIEDIYKKMDSKEKDIEATETELKKLEDVKLSIENEVHELTLLKSEIV